MIAFLPTFTVCAATNSVKQSRTGARLGTGYSAEFRKSRPLRRDFVRSRRKIRRVGNHGGSMTPKPEAQDSLLNAVARKLGRAAGTLANMTNSLTAKPAARESHSRFKTESASPSRDSESVNSRSANPKSTDSGSANPRNRQQKSSARVRQNGSTNQRHATQKRRSAGAETASRRSPSTTKSSSRKKG